MCGKPKIINKPNIIYLVTIFLPALMAGMIAFLYATKWDIHITTLPVWNDEAAYYAQVKMLLQHGVSSGYWGFGGGHALVGTGGAWSAAILLPYVLFGKLFGWTYTSISIANVVFMCVANALFLRLVKVSKEVCIRFFFVELFSIHLWLYTNTQMSEVLRYAMAIVLAGVLYHLFFEEHNPLWFQILAGVYLLYLMQAYIFFSFAVLLYVFALMKKERIFWKKAVAGFAAMAITAGGSYYVLHLISSNYNIFKTERLLNSLKTHNIVSAVKAFVWMAKVGLYDLHVCFRSSTGYGLFHYFVPAIVFFCVAPLVLMIVRSTRAKSEQNTETESTSSFIKERKILAMVAYTMILYVGMYVTVYSLEAFTFFRGMGIPLLFCLALLCCLDQYNLYILFFLAYALALFFLPANIKAFNEERYVLPEKVQAWDALAEKFENTFTLSEVEQVAQNESDSIEKNRWDNTIILFTMEPRVIASLPAGFGQNYIMYEETLPDAKAGYLFFSMKENGLRGDWLEHSYFSVYHQNRDLIEENYFIQYTDGDYVVYKHK